MSTTEKNKTSVDVKKASIWGWISIAFGVIGTLCILNFFLVIIPNNNYQGVYLVRSLMAGLIGLVFGFIDLIRHNDRLSLYGVILNLILVLLFIAYWFLGVLIFGP